MTISYPNGGTLTQVYDTTGRLVQLNWNGAPLVTGLTWNPMGQATAWTWALSTPVAAARSYDTAGRLTATEFSGYAYNAAGRITSLSQYLYQPADTDPTHTTITGVLQGWNVGYDSVGRITAFDAMGSGGNTAGFGYDANGNRSSSTATVNGQTTSRTYTVDGASNKLTGFGQTSGGTSTSVAYGYNANGDLLSDGLRTYTYNAEGRLSTATTGATDTSPTTRYAHNALGQRVFKTEPLYPPAEGDESDPGFFQGLINFFTSLWQPSTSDAEKLGWAYFYDEDGSLVAETGTGGASSSGSTSHIHLPTAAGPMPIAAIINGQKYAVHSDHLNTPRRLTNDSGLPVWQWSYSAFGDNLPTTAASRFASSGAEAIGATSVVFNLRWPGQYYDQESGLHFNWHRSYSPGIGGYTQNDPKGLAAGPNRRIYVDGNPLSFTDPTGLDRWGSYGYGRYIPATNPAPTFWEKLNFPETPEQRAIGENIALGFCGSTIGGVGLSRVSTVIAETLRGKGNITSGVKLSADELLQAGEQFVGPGYKEIGKSGSGVFRSVDGTRQFRIDNSSLSGSHAPGVPHGHLETYAPGATRPTTNNHIPFFD